MHFRKIGENNSIQFLGQLHIYVYILFLIEIAYGFARPRKEAGMRMASCRKTTKAESKNKRRKPGVTKMDPTESQDVPAWTQKWPGSYQEIRWFHSLKHAGLPSLKIHPKIAWVGPFRFPNEWLQRPPKWFQESLKIAST